MKRSFVLGCAALLTAGALWWYPWAVVALSAAVPLSTTEILRSVCLSLAGLALAAYGSALVRARTAALTLILLGIVVTHLAAHRFTDLHERFDPLAGRPSAHESCAPDVATSVRVLSTRESHSKKSPYIDVLMEIEADRAVEVTAAGVAREENSGAKLAMEAVPSKLSAGKGTLTLRLMDADDMRLKGKPLAFSNLQVYLRAPDCDAQPRATLVPRLVLQ